MTASIERAAVALLRREATIARAVFRRMRETGATIPAPTPGRPDWWDLMSVQARDLAAACEAAGLWRVPGPDAAEAP